MNTYTLRTKTSNIKYVLIEFFKYNTIKIIALSIFIILGILTGVFTALKFNDLDCLTTDILIYDFIKEEMLSSGIFFNRLLSAEFFIIILFLCSFTIFTIPIGILLLFYRAYLIGFNIVVMFVFYGLGGCITCLLAIIPCQIIMMFMFIIWQSIMMKKLAEKRKYKLKYCNNKKFTVIMLVFCIIIALLSIVETLLIFLIKSSTILSI